MALGHPLPPFGRLYRNGSGRHAFQSDRNSWIIIDDPREIGLLLALLKDMFSGSSAIVTDATDEFVAVFFGDDEALRRQSGVSLSDGEAKVFRVHQVAVAAFCFGGQTTLLAPRSYRGATEWLERLAGQ